MTLSGPGDSEMQSGTPRGSGVGREASGAARSWLVSAEVG